MEKTSHFVQESSQNRQIRCTKLLSCRPHALGKVSTPGCPSWFLAGKFSAFHWYKLQFYWFRNNVGMDDTRISQLYRMLVPSRHRGLIPGSTSWKTLTTSHLHKGQLPKCTRKSWFCKGYYQFIASYHHFKLLHFTIRIHTQFRLLLHLGNRGYFACISENWPVNFTWASAFSCSGVNVVL